MKKKLLITVVCILLVAFLLSLMPWSRAVSVQTTAYEYALNQKEPLRTHQVTIEGRYYSGSGEKLALMACFPSVVSRSPWRRLSAFNSGRITKG